MHLSRMICPASNEPDHLHLITFFETLPFPTLFRHDFEIQLHDYGLFKEAHMVQYIPDRTAFGKRPGLSVNIYIH